MSRRTPPPLRAQLQARICRGCLSASWFCPTCGNQGAARWVDPPRRLPLALRVDCPHCETQLAVDVIGWEAAPPECLSDRLPDPNSAAARLELAYRQPAASRTQAPPPAAPPPPRAAGDRPAPCPRSTPRRQLADWIAAGLLPPQLTAATIAKGYRRAFGTPPRKNRQTNTYSRRELGLALAALGQEVGQ